MVREGTVRDKLAKFKQIESRNTPAPFSKSSINRFICYWNLCCQNNNVFNLRNIRPIHYDDDDDNVRINQIPATPKADRLSLQFDNDLEQLDSISSDDDDIFVTKTEQKQNTDFKNDCESYDSDRTIELTM